MLGKMCYFPRFLNEGFKVTAISTDSVKKGDVVWKRKP